MSDEIKILCPNCKGDSVSEIPDLIENFTCDNDYCPRPTFSLAQSYKAQLQEARRQIAEKDAELERLKNPGATQYCPACEEAQREIAVVLSAVNLAIDYFEKRNLFGDAIRVHELLKQIRAKYQVE